MSEHYFDIAVIGGGAGGLFAASVANALGAKTCIIEKTKLGGDCTWYGCIPSKAILRSSHVAGLFKRASEFGLKLPDDFQPNTRHVMAHVRDVVGKIATHHEPEDLEKRGIKVFFGPPQFIDRTSVDLNDEIITAKRFILCTGSRALIPPIEGLDQVDYLTNTTVFDLQEIPESLVVLGGGPIGSELSQAFRGLGAEVTLIEMTDGILGKDEPDLAKVVEGQIREDGIDMLLGHKAVRCAQDDRGVRVTVETKDGQSKEVVGEKLLVAIGRTPNIEGLGFDRANIEHDEKGLKINEYLQTTNPNVFACGDLVPPYQFSHVAAYEASVCVRNAMFKRLAWQKVSYENIVWATFTEPELAHLGLGEEEARRKHGRIKVYTTPYTNSDRAYTDVNTEGKIKVITDKKGYILGAHAVGSGAGEILQGLVIAKSRKIKLSQIAQSMFIYPTLSELVKKTAAKPLVESGNNPLVKFVLKVMKNI